MSSPRLRVILGEKWIAQYEEKSDLKTLHRTPSLLIQGNSSVSVIKVGEMPCAVWCGQIVNLKNFQESSHRLEGKFVFIRLDKEGCEVACDRFGQHDLYYQTENGNACFSTDLSLLPFTSSKAEMDPVALAHTLYVYGFRPPKKHTLYKGIRRLGVGEVAVCRKEDVSFQNVPPDIVQTGNYGKEDLVRYSEILLEAVAKRSSPHGNVVYLSSGWDSTALLACLVKLHGPKKVRAVIGRLNFSKRSGVNNPFEIERVQKVADYFKVKLKIVDSDWSSVGSELLERWRPFMRSNMVTGMSFFNWANLAEYVAKTTPGDEALFSGEISDGVHNLGFSQFTTLFHPVLDFREYSDKMASYLFGPTFMRSVEKGTYQEDIVYNFLKQKFVGGLFDKATQDPVVCRRQILASFFLRNNRIPFWSLENSRIFTEQGRHAYSETMEGDYLQQPARMATPETWYSWFVHLYNSFHWQGGTVATLALTARECGLEMHLPFWDSCLQAFLSAMPESWGRGLNLKPTKYPLKWMLKNVIDYPLHLQVGPHSYLYDVNPNFNHAGEFIYASQFTPEIKKSMLEGCYKEVLSSEVFDISYFDRIVSNYLKGKEVVSERTDLAALSFLSLMGQY